MANLPTNVQTPVKVVYTVVLTLSALALMYIMFLCAYLMMGLEVKESSALQAVTHAGDTIIGALVALLINTRTNEGQATPSVGAFPTAVNDQITDAVTQQNNKN